MNKNWALSLYEIGSSLNFNKRILFESLIHTVVKLFYIRDPSYMTSRSKGREDQRFCDDSTQSNKKREDGLTLSKIA